MTVAVAVKSLKRAQVAVRGLWVALTALVITLVAFGVPVLYDRLVAGVDARSVANLGWSPAGYGTYLTILYLLGIIFHLIIAVVVFWRRSDDWMALAMALALVSNGSWIQLSLMYPAGEVLPIWRVLVNLVTYIGLVSGLSLLYVFPDGRPVPRWTGAMVVLWAILMLFAIFLPDSAVSLAAWPIPLQVLVLVVWSGVGLYAQLHRYTRVSSPLQKQQTKWAILGLVLAVLGPFGYFLPFVILPSLGEVTIPNIFYQRVGPSLFTLTLVARMIGLTGFTLGLLVFPISFVIAILRYRLWDIDLIINRTLVYALLTGSLAALYLLGVASLQGIFRVLTGQGDNLAIVATTLGIAAVFNPLRNRIQDVIDRRFYRSRYDAARALASFSGTVQDEVELEDVSKVLLRLVQETIQPTHSSLWLRSIGEQSQGKTPID